MLRRPEPEPWRSARFVTLASLRWVIRHRAYTPYYLVRYWRFLRFKLANPHVIMRGFVFLDKGAVLYARSGHGRMILGRWLHIGANTALRCHEGTLSVGDKSVLGRDCSVNCYLDVELGASTLIMSQGIAKSRVRIGPDVWIGTKVTVRRGVVIGEGAVVGANAVVTRDLPPYCVAVGVPARVVKDRRSMHE